MNQLRTEMLATGHGSGAYFDENCAPGGNGGVVHHENEITIPKLTTRHAALKIYDDIRRPKMAIALQILPAGRGEGDIECLLIETECANGDILHDEMINISKRQPLPAKHTLIHVGEALLALNGEDEGVFPLVCAHLTPRFIWLTYVVDFKEIPVFSIRFDLDVHNREMTTRGLAATREGEGHACVTIDRY